LGDSDLKCARQFVSLIATSILAFCTVTHLAQAQLNQNCEVSVLNRTVQVNPDGTWVLPNVPSNIGQVRARATCVQNGVTTSGQSDFITVPSNGVINQVTIAFGIVAPVPGVLTVATPNNSLTSVGASTQLTLTSTFADGTTGDLTPATSGTNYTTSNPAVATVSPDGLVTAVSSGTSIISAMNEGALGVIAINVVLSGASHGGIPDDWAIAHGLDPNDPAMPFEDPDHDGLTNLQEFQHGTDPHNPDTDGDGIPDGLEVAEGTDPLNPNSFNLGRALKSIQVTPPAFTINFNTLLGEGSRQLIVTGTLNDPNATQIDLTSTRKGTNYTSSDLTVCNFGAVDGQVFAGNSGTCTITVNNSGFTAKTTGIIKTFSPTPLSFVPIPGFANNVKVNGNFAYVAAGSAGLQVVDVTDRTAPHIVASLATPGNANDLRVVGNKVYLAAGSAGLLIIDVSNPLSPTLLGSLATPDIAWDVAIAGNLAFIAAGSSGLRIASISDPTNPTFISSTVAAPSCALGTAKGVAVSGSFALVAAGSGGLQVVDISNPANPQILGCVGMPSGDARKVQAKGITAFVAPYPDSLQIVDFSVPFNPVIVGTTSLTLGGRLQDVAVVSALGQTLAFGADVFFVNGVPITDVTVPSNPVARAIIDFRQFRDDNGHGIAVDSAFVYMTGEEGTISDNGVSGDTRLYIGQYLALEDTTGIPPTALISSPTAGTTVIERQTIPVTVVATDDIAVASVSFSVNGQVVDTQTSPPYQFNFQVPIGISTVTLGAFAVDLGGNVGNALPVQLNVIPDPGTTAIGQVVDVASNPLAGASVTTFGGRSAVTASDGSFSITQVPTVLGNIAVTATFTQPDGSILKGISAPATPVPLGTTQVGTIIVVPVPVITLLSRKAALAGTQVTFHVTGTTLTGSTFAFLPASSPAIVVKSSTIDPSGLSATLTVSVPIGVAGTFALVATNIAGASNATITPANRFTLVNPASRADSDGDGFADVVEAFFGTDPLDLNSIPAIPSQLGEAESASFTLLNNAQPAGTQKFESESAAFTVLNQKEPTIVKNEAASATFTVLNGAQPTGTAHEADSTVFSIQNNSPSVTPGTTRFEAESALFSLENALPRPEAESLAFTVLNRSQSATPVLHEADSMQFSVRNTSPPPPHVISSFEAESWSFSILNRNVTTPGTKSLESESSLFTVRNDSQSATRSVFEMESPAFSVSNTNAEKPVSRMFEAESTEFSVRNTIRPSAPGAQRFEADSLLFTLLNSSQPAVRVVREADSPLFSTLNIGALVNPVGAFEADSFAFTVLNSNQTATASREADSAVFTVVNISPIAGVLHEVDSLIFSLQNNSPSVAPSGNRFETEGPMFSVQNAIPRPEAESMTFTVLNRNQSGTPVIREVDSIPFSARNTAPAPPHVAGKLEAESTGFSILNGNPVASGANSLESESSVFTLRNDSLPATRSVFEMESPSFAVLNGNAGKTQGSFELESQGFSVRNTIPPPAPGAQRFEADSLLFTLLNGSLPSVPVLREAASQLFSTLNTSPSGAAVTNFEADGSAFSLLNGVVPAPTQKLETESTLFTVRNTIAISAAVSGLAVQAKPRKHAKRPIRRQVPGAALRSTTKSHSASSSNGNRKSSTTSALPTSSQTASPVPEKSTTSSNSSNEQQRSQHVSPTLENQQ
jgi:hypothetical protein